VSPKPDTGRWVEGDLELQFSQGRGKKAVWEDETVTGGEPERERHRNEM